MRQPDAARGPCHDRCALRHSTPSIAAEAQYPITRRWLPCEPDAVRPSRPRAAARGERAHTRCVWCGTRSPRRRRPEPAAAQPADFPTAQGKTRQELVGGLTEGPVFAPSASILNVGRQPVRVRAVRHAHRRWSRPRRSRSTRPRRTDRTCRGPYPARRECFAVKSPYRSAHAAGDPRTATRSTSPTCRSSRRATGADRARADRRPARRSRRVPAAGPRAAAGRRRWGTRRSRCTRRRPRTSAATSRS